MAADLASHLSGPAETFYFSLAPETRRDFDELTAELKNRFSSEDVRWRLRQSLSARKQGAKESLDSYIEFINSTCQKLGVSKEDQLHFLVNGLRDEIKREVLMHKPLDYQSAENLARLKVSVDRTIAENRTESIKDTEREILYKLLEKLTPQPTVSAGSSADKKVAAFDVSDRSVSDLSSEMRKLRADLRQEFRDEIRSLRNSFAFPQGSQFSRSYNQPPRREFGPRSQPPRRDFNPRSQPPSVDNRPRNLGPRQQQFSTRDGRTRDGRPTCYRCGTVGHLDANCHVRLTPRVPGLPSPAPPPSLKNSYAHLCAFSRSAYHFRAHCRVFYA